MIIGQKDIPYMKYTKGKRIGYEGTVAGEFLLQRALKANYIKESSVELIEVNAENWLSEFRENSIDALVCFNPVSTILLNKHEGNLLFSSKDIPFEIIDILVFFESFLESNNTVVVNVVKTWFETLEYINSNIEEAAEVIASEKQISPSVYTGVKRLNSPWPGHKQGGL